MKIFLSFFVAVLISGAGACYAQSHEKAFSFEFYDGTFNFRLPEESDIPFREPLTEQSIKAFYKELSSSRYQGIIQSLLSYKNEHGLSDWIFYQLIRKTAQQISPKAENYERYTLYKWFLLANSGYDARLTTAGKAILFYIRSDESISDVPFYSYDNKNYICLNYHDYGHIDFEANPLRAVDIQVKGAERAFSYKVTQMPEFSPENYKVKKIEFNYNAKVYQFDVKLNSEVPTIFANYPGVDFEDYFNIPLSRETYLSLMPALKENVRRLNQKKGVDYLMRFTRYAFPYGKDEETFGKEKRLSPEQTLFYDRSDCDDRVALFFYLTREIYDLPMIALLYPTHITIAVEFKKPFGDIIDYNGRKYTVCEPTPQLTDLPIGRLAPHLRKVPYQIVYSYTPPQKK